MTPHYVTREEHDERMHNFTGFVAHTISEAKADLRREIVESEQRIKIELRAEIAASEQRINTKIDETKQELVERISSIEKRQAADRQMMQTMMNLISDINGKVSKLLERR